MVDLAGLGEGQRLEELVQGAETAGEDDEAARVFDEHRLAGEEVAKLHAEVDVVVDPLLVGQLDVAADGETARLLAALVGGLHDPRSAAGDDRVATLGDGAAGLLGGEVITVLAGGPGGAGGADR